MLLKLLFLSVFNASVIVLNQEGSKSLLKFLHCTIPLTIIFSSIVGLRKSRSNHAAVSSTSSFDVDSNPKPNTSGFFSDGISGARAVLSNISVFREASSDQSECMKTYDYRSLASLCMKHSLPVRAE